MKTIDMKDTKPDFKIAIVVSRFNEEITRPLLKGALERATERGFSRDDISVAWVPGAVEIPIVAQRFAQLGTYDAIIALGAIIRGETDHYDYVCRQVSEGCQTVALQNDVPVIFGVLTTNDEAQARERIGGRHGHKGKDAVDAAMEIVAVLREIG